MRLPEAVIKEYCDQLEYFQRKLSLKDHGINTEEILFLLRQFEQARHQMLSVNDYDKASTIFFNLLHDSKIQHLMKKYGLR